MLTVHAVSLNNPVVILSLRLGFVCVALVPRYVLMFVELLVRIVAQLDPL
jgi:hypothetical protein